MSSEVCILGGGMTGLAAGIASGVPVYEAADVPGGICSSYYVRPGAKERLSAALVEDGVAYRFEIGGGHWIFGGDPTVLQFIRSVTPVRSYTRRSSVYLPEIDIFAPYPIQNHLRHLGPEVSARAVTEVAEAARYPRPARTMADWLEFNFGPTLSDLFFTPFHALYTGGLWRRIAPQDAYKSPVNLKLAISGALGEAPPVGYNVTFIYPEAGLDSLAARMAEQCDIRYGKRAVGIDVKDHVVHFEDGSATQYRKLISTLPLNQMMQLTGLNVDDCAAPHTSVMVLNIGAVKGPRCPKDHWVYLPTSRAGFHRVGFYSNVDTSFLPASARTTGDRVSIYVEKAFADGATLSETELGSYCSAVCEELQEWGWIGDVEVADPTWIDVAYTWSWPGSRWTPKALEALRVNDIYQVGRYARWIFQGIADSIRDGFFAGTSFRAWQDSPTVSRERSSSED